jgi:hypothetical protein
MRATFLTTARRATNVVALAAFVLIGAPHLAASQDVASVEARKAYLGQLEELNGKFVQLAEAIPADKYSWRPAKGVRSVGEAFMHVATEYYLMPPMAFGAKASPTLAMGPGAFGKLEKDATKEKVIQAL